MNRNVRTAVVVGVALVTAGVASYGVYRVASKRPQAETIAMVDTVLAARPLRLGERIAAVDVKVVKWPAASAVEGAYSAVHDVVDRAVTVPLLANEPITPGRVAERGAGAGLTPSIPDGMRAVSVKVNEVVGVAGFTTPGTRVDVLVTMAASLGRETVTRVVVSNAEVLAAGTRQEIEAENGTAQALPSVVTLLVTPSDAERVAHASAEGRIMLSLRNPLDGAVTQTEGTRTSALTGEPPPAPVAPPVRRAAPVAVAPPPPVQSPVTLPAAALNMVEAIRGAKRSNEVIR